MASGREIVAAERLDSAELEEIHQLIADATAADGVPPLSDHARLHLRDLGAGGKAGANLLARESGRITGIAHLDARDDATASIAELVVAPAARGRGMGTALLAAVVDQVGSRPLQVWAHGRLPAAVRLAERLDLRPDRTLLRMTRPLGDGAPDLPAVSWPDGVRVRTFQVGRDEEAWLRVNARAFADLPDQGGWTSTDLEEREAEPWFDPAGFFLAEREGTLLGFHWTKVHSDRPGEPGHPIGEVYVVGVDPSGQGMGLGRALTVVGLEHLQAQGLDTVMLYVDESNHAAVRLYQALGFTIADVDVAYSAETRRTAAESGF